MPSINRRGNSRTQPCCPKFPTTTACCMNFGRSGSEFFTDFQTLDGFTVLQSGPGGTATAGVGGLVLTANSPPPTADIGIIGDVPLINPSTDQFCLCFDLNPSTASTYHASFGGIANGLGQFVIVGSVISVNWVLIAVGPSAATGLLDTAIPVVVGVFTKIKICRLPGDPSNTITVTIGDNAPQQFVLPAGAVPNVPLPAFYDTSVIVAVGPVQVLRSQSFCADSRTVAVLSAPALSAPPQVALRSPLFDHLREIMGLPVV